MRKDIVIELQFAPDALCLFRQFPPFLTLQIAVRMHAIVAILFYGIFIGRFSISSFIVGVRHLPQPF